MITPKKKNMFGGDLIVAHNVWAIQPFLTTRPRHSHRSPFRLPGPLLPRGFQAVLLLLCFREEVLALLIDLIGFRKAL